MLDMCLAYYNFKKGMFCLKRKAFKICALFTALCAVVLAGCSTPGDKAASEDEIVLTYWCGLGSTAASVISSYNDMPMYQKAQEITGVKIDFKHPPVGQEGEQFNLMVASRDFPDIMESGWQSYSGGPNKAINDGIIIKLDDYIEAYAPNYKKILDEYPNISKQLKTDDNILYSFPGIALNAISISTGPIARYDLLEELGMEMPETISEWEEMLRGFKNMGVQAPLTGTMFDFLMHSNYVGAFGIANSYYIDNGKVKFGPLEPNYKSYIMTLRKWYAEGLLDPDVFANNSKNVETNMVTGKSAVVSSGIGGGIGSFTNAVRATNPKYTLKGLRYPVMNKGDEPTIMNRAWEVRNSGMAAITTKSEKPEAAVKFLDFFYGEEGNLLKNFGVEGETYKMIDNYPTYTDFVTQNPNGMSVTQVLSKYTRASAPSPGLIDGRYHEQYYTLPEQQETMKLWNSVADNAIETTLPPITPTQEEADIISEIKANTETYFQEQMTRIIMGVEAESAFDETISRLKTMEIEKTVEIYQNAYERYQKR